MVTIGSYAIGLTVFAKAPDASIYSTTSLDYSMCLSLNASNSECSSISAGSGNLITENILILLCIANMVIGCGSVSLYSIAIAYIEEIANPEKTSLCQAIYYGVGNYVI